MIQIGTFLIGYPYISSVEQHQKFIDGVKRRRFNLMKKHNHNIYSEEHWEFFLEWYHNFYPNRKYYE